MAVAVLGLAHPLFADGGPLSLGGRAMAFFPEHGDTSWSGGAQLRLRLPLFFGVEGSVDYRRNHFGDTTVHDWPVQVTGLLYLPKIILVQPFLLGGGGWYHTTVDGPNGYSDTQTNFAPHAGAGVEVNLTDRWFVDGTYRYVWLNGIDTQTAGGARDSLRDHAHMVTIGLNYRL